MCCVCMFAFHSTDKDVMHTSVHTSVKLVGVKQTERKNWKIPVLNVQRKISFIIIISL